VNSHEDNQHHLSRREMSKRSHKASGDLFAATQSSTGSEALGPGAVVLRAFASDEAEGLLAAVRAVAAKAPFRNMVTPGGYIMSVAMTNAGVGWVTDRKGYRYDAVDPETGKPWPPIPRILSALAARAAQAADFPGFAPDACLINRYQPGTKLSLHQDRNERDFGQPIVSVSLGLPAVFLWGGQHRADRPRRIPLASGDVVVWGGPSRLVFHGVDKLSDGIHPLTGQSRYNLTFRRAL
jgi:alkylated DNA repair protein (DNA oxidative demethylase)